MTLEEAIEECRKLLIDTKSIDNTPSEYEEAIQTLIDHCQQKQLVPLGPWAIDGSTTIVDKVVQLQPDRKELTEIFNFFIDNLPQNSLGREAAIDGTVSRILKTFDKQSQDYPMEVQCPSCRLGIKVKVSLGVHPAQLQRQVSLEEIEKELIELRSTKEIAISIHQLINKGEKNDNSRICD